MLKTLISVLIFVIGIALMCAAYETPACLAFAALGIIGAILHQKKNPFKL